jgi:urea transporter
VLSFAAVLTLGFLLLVWLVVSAGLQRLENTPRPICPRERCTSSAC